VGLAAGIGIVLLARHPEGILGMTWLTDRIRLPFGGTESDAVQVPVEREVASAA
jgi:hypothetical protein